MSVSKRNTIFSEHVEENVYAEVGIKAKPASEDDENYEIMKRHDFVPDFSVLTDSPGNHHREFKSKKSKFERIILIVIVVLCCISVMSAAVAIFALYEGIQLKESHSQVKHDLAKIRSKLQEDFNLQTGQLNALKNETTIKRRLLDQKYTTKLASFTSLMEDRLNSFNYSIYSDMQELNAESRLHLENIVKFEVQRIKEEVNTNLSIIRNVSRGELDNLTKALVSDIAAIHVFESCSAISSLSLPFSVGNYSIHYGNSTQITSCFQTSCNGVLGYWRRIAYYNSSDADSATCPLGLEPISSPVSCRQTRSEAGCSSATYPVNGRPYSRVCGRVHGRYSGSPDGFQSFGGIRGRNPTLDGNYVDGVSLTLGRNRTSHVWTFAAAFNGRGGVACDVCDRNRPSYIGDHYSCEAVGWCPRGVACNSMKLWDGGECVGNGTFYRQLPQETTDEVEMRVCRGQEREDEDILITFIEIFVE